jgi:tetratricopeptide (TPR) repeat protein
LAACTACGPSEPLERAKQLRAEGELPQALELLRELVEAGSEDPEVFYLYGLTLIGSGQPSLAQWPLRRAMEDPEWLVGAGLALADSQIATMNADGAVQTLGRVLEIEPDHVGALNLRSIARCHSRRDYEGALADAERALELEPDNVEFQIPRAVALMGLLRVEEAKAALDELDRRARQETLSPRVAAILCAARASFQKEDGNLEAADQIYTECLEQHPRAAALVQDATGFYDSQDRFDRSLEILRAAYDADRTSRDYRLALASRLEASGDSEGAERVLREATEQPDALIAANAWADLANYYLARGDAGLALPAYEQAMAAGEPVPEFVFAYAEALVLGGRYEKAAEVAAAMKVPAHRELVLARLDLAQGRPQQALARFTEGLRLWPDNAVARYYAARAAEQVGDFDRAVDEYRSSIRAGAGETDARIRLARLYRAEGSPRIALAVLQTDLARSSTPEVVLLELELAAQHRRVGRLPESVERTIRAPGMWPRAVAAIAAGTRRRAGPEAAAEIVRRESLDLTRPVNSPALRELVVSLLESGRPGEALALADAAAQAHPEVSTFHEIRGLALARGETPSEARGAWQRALELDHDSAAALTGLAELATREGDTQAALDLYARAAAADREAASALLAAADLLIRLERSADAEARLTEALERDPYDGKAALRLAELRRARHADAAGTQALLRRAVRFGAGSEAEALLERAGGEPAAAGIAAETQP